MSPDSSDSPKSGLKARKILGILVLVLVVGVIISSNIAKGPFNQKGQSFLPDGQVLGISFSNLTSFFNFNSTFSFMFKSQGLSRIVQDNISGKSGEYAVYIADLTDDEHY